MPPNLLLELDRYKLLREELLRRWPELSEDAEALDDTLEGASTLRDAIAAVVRSSREDAAVAKALGDQIERMHSRKTRLIERADRKKQLALWAMQEAGVPRIDAPDFTATLGTTQGKVVIPDESAVPQEYLRVKTEPDRKAIGAELRAGKDFSWASLGNPQVHVIIKDG